MFSGAAIFSFQTTVCAIILAHFGLRCSYKPGPQALSKTEDVLVFAAKKYSDKTEFNKKHGSPSGGQCNIQ